MNTPHLFRFFYPRRSGSHAIMNWLADVLGGNVRLHNNRRCGKAIVGTLTSASTGPALRGTRKGLYTQRSITPKAPQEILFVSHEAKDIPRVSPRNTTGFTGPGCDIIIIRDIYNWLSSTLVECRRDNLSLFPQYATKKNINSWYHYAVTIDGRDYINLDSLMKSWITHAEEVLGKTDFLAPPKYFILYNRWLLEEQYRKDICEFLGVEYRDELIHHVARVYGKAGSFDYAKLYDGRAQTMALMHRWEFFMSNPIYWKVLERYPEAEELSKELFGEVIPEREKYPLGKLARRFRDEP